jgi:hypothetical protein
MKRGGITDQWLTILFMLLAAASAICYFKAESRMVFILCAGVAVVLRIIQYILRFFS